MNKPGFGLRGFAKIRGECIQYGADDVYSQDIIFICLALDCIPQPFRDEGVDDKSFKFYGVFNNTPYMLFCPYIADACYDHVLLFKL